ncbi:murein L,D-transpeptidase [Ferruginibacter sp.]|uniref:L,D-transpeptidase family protein n=1 Tax=Ferruginibacter sp. TaxID=1940288 RepID=UPI0019C5F068|nr:L,D-transpeptidase family protein [Ferruginibacter sp.]MBC7628104.1 L,D-transpeptidase family protein [Ferruginibacter sp.]
MIKKFLTSFSIIAFFISIIFTNCNNPNSNATATTKDTTSKDAAKEMGIKGSFSNQTKITFDSSIIKKFLDSFPAFKLFEKDIAAFYKTRHYAYAWYDDNGMIEPAHNLYNRIVNISDEGVPDAVPYKTAFTNLMETEEGSDKVTPGTELMLTSQYLAYAKTVWQGLSEKQSLSIEWLLPRKKITSQQLLDSLVSGRDVLQNTPVYRQYNLLKEYLKKYNNLKAQGPQTIIKGDKKIYKLKDSSVTVSAIRQRLFLLGDMEADTHSNIFDDSLQTGIKKFEQRLGYKEDGVVNKVLLAEMNYPVDKRIEQIMVNMERSRWVPVAVKNDFLLINIPEYKLHVYEQDSLAFSMNVVVGKDEHKTVIFNGDMKYIVFSPYWNIPASILKNETLPAMKKNNNYLAQHNMEWNGGNIRQKPGPNNSLGLVKFLFPNTHSIYLHDSPAKSLFNEDKRAFSHGCIRLAEPKKLAIYLLRNNAAWNKTKITAAMNKGVEQFVTLKTTVPVFIAYFTAWVDRQGKLNFRNDVYKRDSRLAKMILKNPAT